MSILLNIKKIVIVAIIILFFTIIILQNTNNFSSNCETVTAQVPDNPKIVWSKNLGNNIVSNLIIDENTIFLVATTGLIVTSQSEGILFALDKTSSEIKWQFDIGEKSKYDEKDTVSIAKYQDLLIVGSNNNGLFAINSTNREIVWTKPHNSVNLPVITPQNKIYYTQSNINLYCLNLYTGKEVWSYPVGITNSVPTIIGNEYIFSADFNHIFALEIATGNKVWNYEVQGQQIDALSTPEIYDEKLIITAADYKLYVLNLPPYKNSPPYGKEVLWEINGSLFYPHFSQPVVNNDKIFLTYNHELHAFDIGNGKLIWERGLNFNNLAVAGDKIITCSGSIIYCLNQQNGDTIWKFDLTEELEKDQAPELLSDAIVTDKNSIYITDQSGTLYKIGNDATQEKSSDINWPLTFFINILLIAIPILVILGIIKWRSKKLR